MVSPNHISPQEEQAQATPEAKTTPPPESSLVRQNTIRRKPVPSGSKPSPSRLSDPAPTTSDKTDTDSSTASADSSPTTSMRATTPSSTSPSPISRAQVRHHVDHGHLGAQLHVPKPPSRPSTPNTSSQQTSAVQTQRAHDDCQPTRVLRVMNGVDDSEGYFREPSPVPRPVTVSR